jgi:hypothetical protein
MKTLASICIASAALLIIYSSLIIGQVCRDHAELEADRARYTTY